MNKYPHTYRIWTNKYQFAATNTYVFSIDTYVFYHNNNNNIDMIPQHE